MASGNYRYDRVVTLRRLFHRAAHRIGMFFEIDAELKDLCKSIDAKYSATHKCWHVENNRDNLKRIFEVFKRKAWVETGYFFDKVVKTKPTITKEKVKISLSETAEKEISDFVRMLQAKGMRDSMVRSYKWAVSIVLSYSSDKESNRLTNDDINAFLSNEFYTKGLSKMYQRTFLIAIKQFFCDMYGKQILIENPGIRGKR